MKKMNIKKGWPEFLIELRYIDKKGDIKKIAHKYWDSKGDLTEMARTSAIIERDTNRDFEKLLKVSIYKRVL